MSTLLSAPAHPSPTATLITFGCKVNQAESASLALDLTRAGYRVIGRFPDEPVSLAIVNTCAVTSKAEAECRRAVKRLHRIAPSAPIAVLGCLAEISANEASQWPGVTVLLGNREKRDLPDHLPGSASKAPPVQHTGGVHRRLPLEELHACTLMDRTRAFLKIQDGCESFCTYCVVPYTRGTCRSLSPEGVLHQLGRMGASGVQEAVLTGIHLGYYGRDLPGTHTLLSLLHRIASEQPGPRIRLSSLESAELDPALVELVRQGNWLAPHFHVPLQSGDPGILRAMHRPYSPEEYADRILTLKHMLPEVCIGADVIVGFPGEGQREFERTLRFIESLPLSYLHVFSYSRRSGTPAADLPDQVSPAEKKERSRILLESGRRKRYAYYRSWIGKTVRLLAEEGAERENGLIRGYSDEYVPVYVPAAEVASNRLIRVRVSEFDGTRLFGKAC